MCVRYFLFENWWVWTLSLCFHFRGMWRVIRKNYFPTTKKKTLEANKKKTGHKICKVLFIPLNRRPITQQRPCKLGYTVSPFLNPHNRPDYRRVSRPTVTKLLFSPSIIYFTSFSFSASTIPCKPLVHGFLECIPSTKSTAIYFL